MQAYLQIVVFFYIRSLGHAVEIHTLKAFPAGQRKILSEILSQGMSAKAARTRVCELLGEGDDWFIRSGLCGMSLMPLL
ncbi:MAG: hypothetical protein R6V86_11860 [Spirochaetia bacterium]